MTLRENDWVGKYGVSIDHIHIVPLSGIKTPRYDAISKARSSFLISTCGKLVIHVAWWRRCGLGLFSDFQFISIFKMCWRGASWNVMYIKPRHVIKWHIMQDITFWHCVDTKSQSYSNLADAVTVNEIGSCITNAKRLLTKSMYDWYFSISQSQPSFLHISHPKPSFLPKAFG